MRCISVGWGFRSRKELEAAGAREIVATPKALYGSIKE